ncbi:uncharacterized protein LOC114517711 [Dendronephthya gigantea]|uniref:uncharacterized protein LOC114517711 n=1 Tax=Dendronephthya gigantea TaxID=151771 RepID=UPI00106C41BD|nr:uncharacterized protein LOC114517711 [Dendronephthya gigantea]
MINMSPYMAVVLSVSAFIFISRILQPGECLVAQAFFRKKDGEYLANHVLEKKHAETELECSMYCIRHGSCVSVNYKTSGIGKGRCELNSKTIEDASDDEGRIRDPDFKHLYVIKKIQPEPDLTSTPRTQDLFTGVLNRTNISHPMPIETSCTAIRIKNTSADSGFYSIMPQGLNFSVRVFCNMTSKGGVGVTVIGHDSESRTFVDGYEAAGSYKKTIKYEISMEQIVAIMNQSKNCEQFIKYECLGSTFVYKGERKSWWVSRQGSKMNYWGGAAVDSGKCACGMTYSCVGGGNCNCDENDQVLREDSGYLTDKNTLPVTELRFGDTGLSSGIFNRTDKSAPIAFETCTILRSENHSADSGKHFIKPRGIKFRVPAFCNMTSKNGAGVTEIGHDSESRTFVTGYEAAGSYRRMIKYEISIDLIVAIMNQSKNCEQFIKYECHSSVFHNHDDKLFAWWVSRHGAKMNYWGGAAVDSGKCACGMTNSCAGQRKCNCDKNEYTWREDSGYLTDKNTLPVTELRFGDTGNTTTEYGYFTLGNLRCWG